MRFPAVLQNTIASSRYTSDAQATLESCSPQSRSTARLDPRASPGGPMRAAHDSVVQGSHLGFEIDVSTFRSVRDTCRRSKECSRHFGVVLTWFTHCLGVVYFPDIAQPRLSDCAEVGASMASEVGCLWRVVNSSLVVRKDISLDSDPALPTPRTASTD